MITALQRVQLAYYCVHSSTCTMVRGETFPQFVTALRGRLSHKLVIMVGMSLSLSIYTVTEMRTLTDEFWASFHSYMDKTVGLFVDDLK